MPSEGPIASFSCARVIRSASTSLDPKVISLRCVASRRLAYELLHHLTDLRRLELRQRRRPGEPLPLERLDGPGLTHQCTSHIELARLPL